MSHSRTSARMLLLVILASFQITIATGQTNEYVDSLQGLLQATQQDTNRVKLLNTLSTELAYSDPTAAMSYGVEALKLSRALNYNDGEARALARIGDAHRVTGNLDSALYYFEKGLGIRLKQHNKPRIASASYNVAIAFKALGNYDSAAVYYDRALHISEEVNDLETVANSLNGLGTLYWEQDDVEDAITYYEKSLALWQKRKSERGIAQLSQNLASCYDYKEDYIRSSELFRNAIGLYEKLGDIRGQADCNLNLGISYNNRGEAIKGLPYLQKALTLHQSIDDQGKIANDFLALSLVYAAQNDYSTAITNSAKSLEISEEVGNRELILASYTNLTKWYNEIKDYKSAYLYANKAFVLRDSIYNENKTETINGLKTKYETEKKDQQIQLLNKDKELQTAVISRQHILRDALIAIAALILLVGGLYINRIRLVQKHRTLAEHKRISSDLHDDIGATLSSFSITSEVIKHGIKSGNTSEVMEAVETIGNESRELMERLSDIVWAINPRNDSFEKVISRLHTYAQRMCTGKNITLQFEADDSLNQIELPMEVRNNYFLIAKESVNNAVKYSGCTELKVHLHQKGKTVMIDIVDDGKGFDMNEPRDGNGLRNMKQRAEDIQAAFELASAPGKGTQMSMSITS